MKKECPACCKKVTPIKFKEIIRHGIILNIWRWAERCPKCGEIIWSDI